VIVGVYIQKTKQFEEQIEKINLEDLQKNVLISFLMIFSIISLISMHTDNNKIKLFLDIAIDYSESLESYADTLNILTNQ
jgi:hypothetical protein